MLRLEECDFETAYKRGKTNTNADVLSWIEVYTKDIQNRDYSIKKFSENIDDDAWSMCNNSDDNQKIG